jgi:hypothetical protein
MRSQITAAALGVIIASSSRLSAQVTAPETSTQQKPNWELLVSSGAVLPTGTQRDAIKQGKLTAAQVSYVVRPALALTASFGWARTRDIATVGDPKLDAFTYDAGAEVRAPRWMAGKGITLSPFAGVGAGGRSYNYRSLDVEATHNAAAYGSVGGEIGVRRIRLRVEARDYVSGFKPLGGEGASRTGNEVVVMAGLRFVRH